MAGPSAPEPSHGTLRRLARAVLFTQRQRRNAMFYGIVAAGLMMVAGLTLLDGWLRANLTRFAVYWLVCAWLTLLALLLAVFDLLIVRAQGRRARRELREQFTAREDEGP